MFLGLSISNKYDKEFSPLFLSLYFSVGIRSIKISSDVF
jgi:hypothetical protein